MIARDHRGKPARLLTIHQLDQRAGTGVGLRVSLALSELEQPPLQTDRRGCSAAAITTLAILVTLAGLISIALVFVHLGPIAGLIALVLVAGLLSAAVAGIRERRSSIASRNLITAALYQKICMQCGYSLTRLEPDPDDCTTCPECGAAWRLPSNDHL